MAKEALVQALRQAMGPAETPQVPVAEGPDRSNSKRHASPSASGPPPSKRPRVQSPLWVSVHRTEVCDGCLLNDFDCKRRAGADPASACNRCNAHDLKCRWPKKRPATASSTRTSPLQPDLTGPLNMRLGVLTRRVIWLSDLTRRIAKSQGLDVSSDED
uniref:Zn(2)-C6 fungal-type domain-containing protein n=1 Tax=Moniliophthora roreri TaxID=221103 RepID=A0A0W0FVQ1_MONRR